MRRRRRLSLLETLVAEAVERLTDAAIDVAAQALTGPSAAPPPPAAPPPSREAPTGGPYEVLGLAPSVSREAADGAWKGIVKRHHPDAGGDPAKFRRYCAAWETLKRERGWI